MITGHGVVAANINGMDNNYYYHQDEQGSTAIITDENADIKNSYHYDAFGKILESQEALPNRITYTGQQYDPLTQQYYLRARYYNPIIGRFTQEDIYRGDGLNLYAYCSNNPVSYYDPTGYAKEAAPLCKNSAVTDADGGNGKGSGNGKKTNYEGYVKSGKGQPPQKFSPEGAGKNGAFRESKRASGVPVSQQPTKIVNPGIGKNGKPVVGGGKDYYFKSSNGNEVVIRQHNEHIYEDDPIQNRGTHFNDKYGNHYDYEE